MYFYTYIIQTEFFKWKFAKCFSSECMKNLIKIKLRFFDTLIAAFLIITIIIIEIKFKGNNY